MSEKEVKQTRAERRIIKRAEKYLTQSVNDFKKKAVFEKDGWNEETQLLRETKRIAWTRYCKANGLKAVNSFLASVTIIEGSELLKAKYNLATSIEAMDFAIREAGDIESACVLLIKENAFVRLGKKEDGEELLIEQGRQGVIDTISELGLIGMWKFWKECTPKSLVNEGQDETA